MDAQYNLSAIAGSSAGFVDGINSGDISGSAVAMGGDFNGDGISDILIGAPGANSGQGQSYVIFGTRDVTGTLGASFDLSSLNGTNGVTINGVTAGDSSGSAVAMGSDFNGDGISDILIGAFGANSMHGQSYVIFGTRDVTGTLGASFDLSSLNGTNGFTINGVTDGDISGSAVAMGGDFNSDGISDILIGAPGANSMHGQSYVIFGTRDVTGTLGASFDLSSLNGTNGFTINGVTAGDISGNAVAMGSDFNGDGISDILIGAPGANSMHGQSYVIFGTRDVTGTLGASFDLSSLNGTNGFTINGVTAGDISGRAVAMGSDFNGDGISDILIGAPGANSMHGQSYVIFGTRDVTGTLGASFDLSSLNGTNGFTVNGVTAYDYSGNAVAMGGDFNGDGISDILIGAPGANSMHGQSYVIFGTRDVTGTLGASFDLSSLNGTNGFTVNGVTAYDYSGNAVAMGGDFNGDGISDILIGAPGANSMHGQSYVIFGTRDVTGTLGASFDLSSLNGTNGFTVNGVTAYDYSGNAVAMGGDFNGDGISDILIGAPGANSMHGQSYVIFGTRDVTGTLGASFDLSSLNGTNGFTINGVTAGDISGRAVAMGSDFNGYGISNILIGSPAISRVYILSFPSILCGTNFLLPVHLTCSSDCPTNFWPNSATQICSPCSQSCSTCSEATENDCFTCAPGYFRHPNIPSTCSCNAHYG